tara:strand:+ start:790 stop:2988 length:2199 start_codon:yes stop_codon:yes gene_type:complete
MALQTWEIQRNAALAGTFEPTIAPIVSEPVVDVPLKSAVVPETFSTFDSPFEGEDLYSDWFSETERNQRSPDGYTPDLLASLGMTAEELAAGAAKRDADNAAALARITPEQLARLEAMDLSGLSGGITGRLSGGLFGNTGQVSNPAVNVGTFTREKYYNDTTAYNPLGTAPEDMVAFDDLNSPEALAAKASREDELSKSLQSWADPLKALSESDPTKFGAEYSALPLTGQLAYLRNEFDNGEMGEREYQDAFAEQWNASGNAGTLKFIDKYGYRMYAPDAIEQQGGQDPNGPMDWYETEGLFDGSIDRLDQFTPRVKESFDVTSIGRGLLASPVLRLAAGVMTGGLSEGVIAAGKGLTGDTLHTSDWLSIGTAGLTISGMIAPPVDAAAAADAGTAAMQAADAAGMSNAAAMAAGTAAQELALAGKGLSLGGKALDYKQSLALMNVAATGKPENMLIGLYGGDLINKGLSEIGITEQTFNDLGIQYDDFQAGLTKTVEKVAAGEDFDKALLSGLGKYITEGGTIGNANGMLGSLDGIDLKAIEDLVRDVVRPIGTMATAVAHYVEDSVPDTTAVVDAIKAAGSVVDDELLQPAKEVVEAGASATGDVLSAADTAARDALSAVDDAVIQPTGQALSDLDTAIRDALGDIEGPDIDIDIPSFNPDIDLDLNLGGQQAAVAPQLSPTRTTDELFTFNTKIKSNQEMIDFAANNPASDRDLIDFSADPFAPDYRGL